MKAITALLLTVCLFGCTEKKQPNNGPQTLPVMTISSGSGTTFSYYPASIEGVTNIEIRPQISGLLKGIFVDDGAYVTRGQTLFQIEDSPFKEKLNNAMALLYSANGALAKAQLEVDKLEPLVQNNVVSDYQLKTALAAKEVALGDVAQAKAEIAGAKINLGYTIIKASNNGFIGRLLRKQGSLISPSDPSPLTELSDVHTVHVFFSLGEYDFLRFRDQYAGKTISDKIKHLPPVELVMANDSIYGRRGHVDIVNGQFDRNTGAITLRATFRNDENLLRSGNTGKIKLGLQFSNELVVPQSATLEMQDQTFVFCVGDSNKVFKQPITILARSGENYLVSDKNRKGLKGGDRIVSNGFDHLHEGDIIIPKKVTNDLTTNH